MAAFFTTAMISTEQGLYEVAIGLVPGVGNQLTRQLISFCGSPEAVFKEKKGKLLKIPGVGKNIAHAITQKDALNEAEKEIAKAEKQGVKLFFYTSEDYPERLKNVHDAPALLYLKGGCNLNVSKVIAIVGTRNATEYGRGVVETLVDGLSHHQDLLITSGLAYGIDIMAHKACLQHQIPTVGVMGTGVDLLYPAAHKETAKKMLENGGVLTEYRMGTKPEPSRFPARNRIIAGMSDAVIVVEAAEKGGALITAEIANSYHREVFAVPGDLGHKYSEGCNKLIKTHKANILTSVEDIEYIMNWTNSPAEKEAPKDYNYLEDDAHKVVMILQGCDHIVLDELSWQSQIPLSQLAGLLLNLEFEGIVRSLPGKRYQLTGK